MKKIMKRFNMIVSGKNKDVYTYPNESNHLYIVYSDRITAWNTIMKTPIPSKWILSADITRFWFDKLSKDLSTKYIPNHFLSVSEFPVDFPENLKQQTIVYSL